MKEIKNKILENLSYLTKSYDMQNPTKDIITGLINKSFNTLPNNMQTKLLSIGQDINTSLEKLRVSFKKYKCWIIIIHATNYFLFNRLNMIMKMCKKKKAKTMISSSSEVMSHKVVYYILNVLHLKFKKYAINGIS